MLILHPSSRCDVCLSEYAWDDIERGPYAIACGHIFCGGCLYSINPTICPLCRTKYVVNKMKKLHVDKLDTLDDNIETDLMQRLSISWESAPEQLKEITDEVDAYLGEKPDDSCISLRKLRAALKKHELLKTSRNEMIERISNMEDDYEQQGSLLIHERQMAEVYSEAQKAAIDQLKRQVANLTNERKNLEYISKKFASRSRRNPLPRPPQPISTDQVPTFEQVVSEAGSTLFRNTELPPTSSPVPKTFQLEKRRIEKGKAKQEFKFVEKFVQSTPEPGPSTALPRYNSPPPSYNSPLPRQTPTPAPSSLRQSTSHPELRYVKPVILETVVPRRNQPLDTFSILTEYVSAYQDGRDSAMRMMNQSRNEQRSPDPSRHHQPQLHQQHESSSFNFAEGQSEQLYSNPSHYAQPTTSKSKKQMQFPPRKIHRFPPVSPIPSDDSIYHELSTPVPASPRVPIPETPPNHYTNPRLASTSTIRPERRFASPSSPLAQVSPTRANLTQVVNEVSSGSRPTFPTSRRPLTPSARANLEASLEERMRKRASRATVSSWGTPTPSQLSRDGSVFSDLLAFRLDGFHDGQTEGPGSVDLNTIPLNYADHGSVGSEEDAQEVGNLDDDDDEDHDESDGPHSPVRPVHSMVGVLPSQIYPDSQASHSPAHSRSSLSSFRRHGTPRSSGSRVSFADTSEDGDARRHYSGSSGDSDHLASYSDQSPDIRAFGDYESYIAATASRAARERRHRRTDTVTNGDYEYPNHDNNIDHFGSHGEQSMGGRTSPTFSPDYPQLRAPRTAARVLTPGSPFPISIEQEDERRSGSSRGSSRRRTHSSVSSRNALGLEL